MKLKIKFLFLYPIGFLLTMGCFFLGSILLLVGVPQPIVIKKLGQFWGSTILKLAGIKFEVQGAENLTCRLPCIFMANHQSMLEVFCLGVLLPPNTLHIMKREIIWIPFFGWFLALTRQIFVDRHHHASAMETMNQVRDRAQTGCSIFIAVEGTRSPDGKMLPFKRGGFHLAVHTKLPVVPITILNAYQLMPKHHTIAHPGTVKVIVDPPVSTSHWTTETLDDHIKEIRSIIAKNLPEELRT